MTQQVDEVDAGSARRSRRRLGVGAAAVAVIAVVAGLAVVLGAGTSHDSGDARSDAAIGLSASGSRLLDQVPVAVLRDAFRSQQADDETLALVREEVPRSSGRIDTTFWADTEGSARQLADFLRRYTSMRVEVDAPGDGVDQWSITGTTPPAPLTLPVVHELTLRMTEAAWRYGRCQFDGWGTGDL